MKRVLLFAAIAGLFMTSCSNSGKENEAGHADSIKNDGTYNIDPSATSLKWVGTGFGHSHNGTIKVVSGSLMVENGAIKSGNFEVDMNTIVCEDEKDTAKNAKLLNHLRSPDFFAVDSFKTANFSITSVAPAANGGVSVTGDLTIRGIKNQIVIPASVAYDSTGGVKVTSTFKFDRTKHNVRYKAKSFMDAKAIADGTIEDDIELTLELVAKK